MMIKSERTWLVHAVSSYHKLCMSANADRHACNVAIIIRNNFLWIAFNGFSISKLSLNSVGRIARDIMKISKMSLQCHKANINAWKSCWKSLCVVLMRVLCLSVKHALVGWYGGIKMAISCRIYLNLQNQVNSTPGMCSYKYYMYIHSSGSVIIIRLQDASLH